MGIIYPWESCVLEGDYAYDFISYEHGDAQPGLSRLTNYNFIEAKAVSGYIEVFGY